MSELRDITVSDTGRGGHGVRLAVLAVALAIIAATVLLNTPRAAPVASTARAAPTPNPYPRSAGLLGASLHDSVNGWLLVGDTTAGGTLWRTADGGHTWSVGLKLDGASTFGGLSLGGADGYVATLSLPQGIGVAGWWTTGDSGRTFEQHPFPNPPRYLLVGVSTTVDGGAFALFSDGNFPPTALVYSRASDGLWEQVDQLEPDRPGRPVGFPPIPLIGSRTAFAFVDRRHGVIATQTDASQLGIYSTADGGHSWTLHLQPGGEAVPPEAVSATAVDGELLVAASYGPAVDTATTWLTRSDDGGASWDVPQELPTADGLETPTFVSRSVWWVPMGRGVLVTRDAGAHWFRGGLDLPGTTRVEAVYAVDGQHAWAFAGAGLGPPELLYETTDGIDWTIRKPPG